MIFQLMLAMQLELWMLVILLLCVCRSIGVR